MELRLQFLESFPVQGSDGGAYKVCAYERMARDDSIADGLERWESTGVLEYRLEDGRLVDARKDGSMHIAGSPVALTRAAATQAQA
ncbi:MAG TPA: hypothetical protein VGD76_17585 [Ramlibacter sp.]